MGRMDGGARDNGRRSRALLLGALLLASLATVAILATDPGARRRVAPYRFRITPAPTWDAEIAFYEDRLRRHPEGALDLAALAAAWTGKARQSGQGYDRAERLARKSIDLLPDNRDALLVLARIAHARHDFGEALRLARELQLQHPHDEGVLALLITTRLATGDLPQALRAADAWADRRPTLPALSNRALVLAAAGRLHEAEVEFLKALGAEEPGETEASAWTRTMLGRLCLRTGRPDHARDLFGDALNIMPGFALALGGLGDLEIRSGRPAEAERLYGAAFQSSSDALYLARKARAKSLRGDAASAAVLWDEAERMLRSDPPGSSVGHRRDLARLLLERDRPGDAAEALSLMEKEAGLRRDAETLETLAWALSRAGRGHEAREAVREALRSGARDEALYLRAAAIEQSLGNHARASTYRDLAAALNPS